MGCKNPVFSVVQFRVSSPNPKLWFGLSREVSPGTSPELLHLGGKRQPILPSCSGWTEDSGSGVCQRPGVPPAIEGEISGLFGHLLSQIYLLLKMIPAKFQLVESSPL